MFSPSVHLDSLWTVVKDYSSNVLGVPPEEETFFDAWDEAKLSEILSTQKAVVKHQKEAANGKGGGGFYMKEKRASMIEACVKDRYVPMCIP